MDRDFDLNGPLNPLPLLIILGFMAAIVLSGLIVTFAPAQRYYRIENALVTKASKRDANLVCTIDSDDRRELKCSDLRESRLGERMNITMEQPQYYP